MAHVSPLEAAAALNTQDFVRAFKLDRLPILNRVSSQIMRYPARRISRTVLQFDHISGTQGVRASSQWLIRQFSAEVRVHNVEAIPTDRPLLVVSNHPGMIDAMAIWAHLPRPEVRTIAAERPILGLLPHINQHIFFVPDDPQRRSGFVRRVVRYLVPEKKEHKGKKAYLDERRGSGRMSYSARVLAVGYSPHKSTGRNTFGDQVI